MQLEALYVNRLCNPENQDIYIGLAEVKTQLPNASIDDIAIVKLWENPQSNELDANKKLVLVSRWLPEESGLDYRLKQTVNVDQTVNIESAWHSYLKDITLSIAKMHKSLKSLSDEDAKKWGGIETLQKKSKRNLSEYDKAAKKLQELGYAPEWLESFSEELHVTTDSIYQDKDFQEHIKERVQQKKIRRNHGDLKSANIRLAEDWSQDSGRKQWQKVVRMDVIDFEPLYCNIDDTSDISMLVVDIEARTGSSRLANRIKNYYLKLTSPKNRAAQATFPFYLVDKAIVCGYISILYDNDIELGLKFFEVAKNRLPELQKQLKVQQGESVTVFEDSDHAVKV